MPESETGNQSSATPPKGRKSQTTPAARPARARSPASDPGPKKGKEPTGILDNAYIPPLVGGVLVVIQLILTWGRLPIVIATFLALFIFMAGALAGKVTIELLRVSRRRREDVTVVGRVVNLVIMFIALLMCAGLTATFSSLFFGVPVDLRQYVRPDLVSRKTISGDSRPLTPVPLAQFKRGAVVPGSSPEQQAKQLEYLLFDWIRQGAVPADQLKGLAFAFELQSFDEFYQPFNAELSFDRDATKETLIAARLADGVAFLESESEKGTPTYRQIPWYIDRDNGLKEEPVAAKANKLFEVFPNKGDKLILIAKLTSMDGKQLILGTKDVACHLNIVK